MSEKDERNIAPRRNFLKGSIVAGIAGVASMTSVESVFAENQPAVCAAADDFLKAPDPIPDSKISKTVTTDVVIIGAGIAGLSAARAALEGGAKVAVIEKATDIVYRSSDVGTINSSIAKKLGNNLDTAELVTYMQDTYGWRTNGDLWRFWAENSGASLDWLLEASPSYKLIDELTAVDEKTEDVYVRMPHWPHPKGYDPSKEHFKIYSTVIQFLPDLGPALRNVEKQCVKMGADFQFSTAACQLIRPNNKGRVQGVIAQGADGKYIKFLASKGVVLCTGDYSGDKKMLTNYCPQVADLYTSIYFNRDAKGVVCNTGEGHRMGMWVGGQMERGPHAPVTHSIGGPLGINAFLLVNARGKRFMNEDSDGQSWTNAIEREPQASAFQVFDSRWKEQLAAQSVNHGNINAVLPDDQPPGGGPFTWSSYTTEKRMMSRGTKKSDTLEGLAHELGLPTEKFVATVKRYNEMARAGSDVDYFKRADRLFAIDKAPFFGGRTGQALLVVMGGLVVDNNCAVQDAKLNPIPGLWASGNAMGGRFACAYAMGAAGVSHGSALTFGRLAGQVAAKG